MFAYFSWYTVALLWIFRMEKKMRKMQCYTEYIQGCTQYKSVHTDTRLCIHRWNLYIWAYTHMSKYKIVYTLMNAVYLRTSPYIRVYMRMWHFAKTCMPRRFELGISYILQGCSDTTPPALIPNGVSCDICMLNWGSSLSLGAFWLMSDVLCWAGSTPAPAMMGGFAKRGFKFKPPGPGSALPGCQWVPCDPNLSQSAYIWVRVIMLCRARQDHWDHTLASANVHEP